MNKIKKIFSMCLAVLMIFSILPATALAAEYENATIDMDAECSLSIWKYDFTNAKKDGVWDEDSFVSTGWRESYVEDILGGAIRTGESSNSNSLGNGGYSNGYAIEGVEFTYLRVADIVTLSESIEDQNGNYVSTQILYGLDKVKADDLLAAIGLADGAQRHTSADSNAELDGANNYYYTSDVLNAALANALEANPTAVKNALEDYIISQQGTPMPLTGFNGNTIVRELPVGLYLLVETKVPEMVTTTVNPFFVSLPMTTVSGDDNSASPEGGHFWNYNVTVYPKNETGIPTLEKTVREAFNPFGSKSTDASGFSHVATGSGGDIVEYRIVSTLPTITSDATSLSVYEFYDTLSKGLTYNQDDEVIIEIFADKDFNRKVATWTKADDTFAVDYSADGRHMTISMLRMGLEEINGGLNNANGAAYAGYSNYTMVIYYSATINSDNSFVYGDEGNDNEVVLTWKRTSSNYVDTLIDDAHVYSYGIDLTKKFSDKESDIAHAADMFDHVKFKAYNETDGYWLIADCNDRDGVYYVTGGTVNESEATVFSPIQNGDAYGKIIVMGCENDTYRLTEVETADGYTLLKDSVYVTISVAEDANRPCNIYSKDVLGVLQNDPCYRFDGGMDLELANIPQKQLSHNHLTATATVAGNDVNMLADEDSDNAFVPLTIVNTRGYDLPMTGDLGTWMYGVFGIGIMAAAAFMIFFVLRKREDEGKTIA